MSSKYQFIPDRETGLISEEATKSYFSRLGWGIFTLGVASSLASAGISALVAIVFAPFLENQIVLTLLQHIITLIAIYGIAMPLFCKVVKPLPKVTPIKSKMSAGSFIGGICVAFLLMSVGNYISNIVLTMIHSGLNTTTQNPIDEAISPNDPWIVLLTTIFMVVLFPILEELLFRKIICDRLLPLGEGYAIFVSATVFGLIHGNFYQFPYAFLLGALFALIYVKTGKLIYTTVYHIIINFFGAVLTPWIIGQVDLEGIFKLLESETLEMTPEIYTSLAETMFWLLIYDAITLIPAIAGIILLVKARKKQALKLESGILMPPKKGRFANIFCTVGVAAAITYFVLTFILSIMPTNL